MKTKNKFTRILGVIIFSIGIALGLILAVVAVWGDAEAVALFSTTIMADETFSIRCPVIMTTTETPAVRASFKNPIERDVKFTIRTYLSDDSIAMSYETLTILPVAAGETQQLQWTVTPENIVFRRLILVKVLQHRLYPIPGHQGLCGILVLDLPYFTGTQIVIFSVVFSLLCIALGAIMWRLGNQPIKGRMLEITHAMDALAVIVLFDMVIGLAGTWLLGIVSLAIAALLIVIILMRYLFSS